MAGHVGLNSGVHAQPVSESRVFVDWRRERDSNPRWGMSPYSLSRGAPSTTRPSLRRLLHVLVSQSRPECRVFPRAYAAASSGRLEPVLSRCLRLAEAAPRGKQTAALPRSGRAPWSARGIRGVGVGLRGCFLDIHLGLYDTGWIHWCVLPWGRVALSWEGASMRAGAALQWLRLF